MRTYRFLSAHGRLTRCPADGGAGAVPLSPPSGNELGGAGGPCGGRGPAPVPTLVPALVPALPSSHGAAAAASSARQRAGSAPLSAGAHGTRLNFASAKRRFLTECPN